MMMRPQHVVATIAISIQSVSNLTIEPHILYRTIHASCPKELYLAAHNVYTYIYIRNNQFVNKFESKRVVIKRFPQMQTDRNNCEHEWTPLYVASCNVVSESGATDPFVVRLLMSPTT